MQLEYQAKVSRLTRPCVLLAAPLRCSPLVLALGCVCLHPTLIEAQGIVGGRAVDEATLKPLSCIEVAMLDSADQQVLKTRARTDGTFEFRAPAKGAYRFAFLMSRHRPSVSAPELFEPTTDSERTYRIALSLDTTEAAYFDSTGVGLWFQEPGQASGPSPRDLGARTSNGYAIVRYAIDVNGRVVKESVEALSSSGPAFARAATEPLLGWRFITARFPPREPVCVMLVAAQRWGTMSEVLPAPKPPRPGGSILNPRPPQ